MFALAGLLLVGVGVDRTGSRPLVMSGLALSGLGIGVWDVGMNLEGASVERALGRSIMPRFHAAFSAGTVLSAFGGSALSAWRTPVLSDLAATGLLVTGVGLVMLRSFLPPGSESRPAASVPQAGDPALSAAAAAGPAYAWLEARTLLIGVVTFVAAFTEGTANDWLSVAMVEGHHLPAWAGVLGFAVFLTAMTLGRIVGTRFLDRFGRVRVLRLLFVVALGGAALVVVGGTSLFLAGPPLLGFLGDRVGVLRALLLVGPLVVLALAALPAVRAPSARRG
ncbi:MAG: hypothetical protein ACOYBY_02435 [Dermatophilaceae bacterium]